MSGNYDPTKNQQKPGQGGQGGQGGGQGGQRQDQTQKSPYQKKDDKEKDRY